MEDSTKMDATHHAFNSTQAVGKQVFGKIPGRIAEIHLVSSHPEVYEPCDDSFALVDALLADRTNLLEHRPMLCMEVGCGSGYVITSLALMLGQEANGLYYLATDINPHAARVTTETLEVHGVHAEVISTDIALGLEKRLTGLVDVMVVNPPYVPTPECEVGGAGITSAWAGGENGRSVIDKILPVADSLLSENGWLYMVTVVSNNPSQICAQMWEKGFASRIAVQRSTEEESLHVIKFWRDLDRLAEAKAAAATTRTISSKIIESVLSQFPSSHFGAVTAMTIDDHFKGVYILILNACYGFFKIFLLHLIYLR
ncbi:hypothetical protein Nepgr_029564 [Nepenthes gracilis]|uniref:Methyltransferase small domain-containing protein n=1 Tax=Nepenthes gracilis TaxID=150966 RepID=A0AAD3Y5N2_NEPGR|nr:hypothetical protein Nepgr_029564 [Nepenthes gracilis]